MVKSPFVRNSCFWFILILSICVTLFYLHQTFNYDPIATQVKVKPDIEIHFGGPPLQEREK